MQPACLSRAQPDVASAPARNFDEQRLACSTVIHKGHHIGRVPFAKHLNLGEAYADLFQVAFAELHVERSHVLLKIANTLRARDGYEVVALGENPREGQLCRGRAFLAGELFYG